MSSTISAHILGWSFAPIDVLLEDDEALIAASLSPEGMKLDFVPPALRRRCSNFSKVTLAVAHAALSRSPEITQPHTIFASSHGESGITRDLLTELASDQPLSPMGFSLSVHNAASGLYSIATGNRAPSSAIAAGEDTFLMGLSDALMTLNVGRARNVLCVCSDERVPQEFLRDASAQAGPYALSLLLGAAPGATSVSIAVERHVSECSNVDSSIPQAVQFARWLHEGGESLSLVSRSARWSFSVSNGSARDLFMTPYR